MILIKIASDGEKVTDYFKKENVTLAEVSSALLKLKQIEHELIKIQFKHDIEISEEGSKPE